MEIDDFGVETTFLGTDPRLWPLAWKKFANAYAEEYRIYYLARACGNRLLVDRIGKRVVQYRHKSHGILNWRSSERLDAKVKRIYTGENKPIKEV